MKYIGNFFNWIKPEWLDEVITHPGFEMPKHSLRNEARFNPILKSYLKDVDNVLSQQEYDQLITELDAMDSNDNVVRHARIHSNYLDPKRNLDEEYGMYHDAGYDVWADHFRLMEKFDVSFDILEDPPPFLDWKDKHITWWFSKMDPGHIMPMHIDKADPNIKIPSSPHFFISSGILSKNIFPSTINRHSILEYRMLPSTLSMLSFTIFVFPSIIRA
jgi:hypothetical protein